MGVSVRIPTPLRKFTAGEAVLNTEAGSIQELIQFFRKEHSNLAEQLLDDEGRVRRFVNVYVNSEDIRHLDKEETPLKDGDEVSIIPAIAGG